jgi:hypothetical protein
MISARMPSTTNVSCTLYQNITARKISRKGKSRTSVTAAELMNSRMDSIPCIRAAMTPVGRFWK